MSAVPAEAAPALHPMVARRGGKLMGRIRVPGDKSISHRALLLGLLTVGRTTIEGLLEGEDILATARACAMLGARIERSGDGAWQISGVGIGSLLPPAGRARLRQRRDGRPTDDGDRRRPSDREQCSMATPACASGRCAGCSSRSFAWVREVLTEREGGRLAGSPARGTRAHSDRVRESGAVGSGEIGGALVRACRAGRDDGDRTGGDSRPHRADARAFRRRDRVSARRRPKPHRLKGRPELAPQRLVVPGRSVLGGVSARCRACRAGLRDRSRRHARQSPAHRAFSTTLREMGASDRGDRSSRRRRNRSSISASARRGCSGVDVPAQRAPSMIDEYPVLAVAAAFAEGMTTMRGLAELRVKESDRLAAIAAGLRANGVACEMSATI